MDRLRGDLARAVEEKPDHPVALLVDLLDQSAKRRDHKLGPELLSGLGDGELHAEAARQEVLQVVLHLSRQLLGREVVIQEDGHVERGVIEELRVLLRRQRPADLLGIHRRGPGELYADADPDAVGVLRNAPPVRVPRRTKKPRKQAHHHGLGLILGLHADVQAHLGEEIEKALTNSRDNRWWKRRGLGATGCKTCENPVIVRRSESTNSTKKNTTSTVKKRSGCKDTALRGPQTWGAEASSVLKFSLLVTSAYRKRQTTAEPASTKSGSVLVDLRLYAVPQGGLPRRGARCQGPRRGRRDVRDLRDDALDGFARRQGARARHAKIVHGCKRHHGTNGR